MIECNWTKGSFAASAALMLVLLTAGDAAAQQAPYLGTPVQLPGIIEAENYDLGGEGVAYHDTTTGNTGGQYRADDVDIAVCPDAGRGYTIGWTVAGEWLEYTVNVSAAGLYNILVRTAAATGNGGTFHIEMDGVDVTGPRTVPVTGSNWDRYRSVTVPAVPLNAGQQVLRFCIDSGLYAFNRITVVSHPVDYRQLKLYATPDEFFEAGGYLLGMYEDNAIHLGHNNRGFDYLGYLDDLANNDLNYTLEAICYPCPGCDDYNTFRTTYYSDYRGPWPFSTCCNPNFGAFDEVYWQRADAFLSKAQSLGIYVELCVTYHQGWGYSQYGEPPCPCLSDAQKSAYYNKLFGITGKYRNIIYKLANEGGFRKELGEVRTLVGPSNLISVDMDYMPEYYGGGYGDLNWSDNFDVINYHYGRITSFDSAYTYFHSRGKPVVQDEDFYGFTPWNVDPEKHKYVAIQNFMRGMHNNHIDWSYWNPRNVRGSGALYAEPPPSIAFFKNLINFQMANRINFAQVTPDSSFLVGSYGDYLAAVSGGHRMIYFNGARGTRTSVSVSLPTGGYDIRFYDVNSGVYVQSDYRYGSSITVAVPDFSSGMMMLVRPAAIVITQHPQPQCVAPGGNAVFSITASSECTLAYKWQKNGLDLSEGGHYSGVETATLTVAGADAGDEGSYRCVVSGTCGSLTSNEAALVVDGQPPSVPVNVTATVQSSTSVRVQWAASTDNVGVTGYKVFRNASLVATAATTSYTDAGLTPGMTYSYTVLAYDGAGNQSAQSSPPTVATTPTTVGAYSVVDIGTLGGAASKAYGLNNLAQVDVAGESQIFGGSWRAFRWHNGPLTDIHPAGKTSSQAYGVNDSREMAGVVNAGDDAGMASYWSAANSWEQLPTIAGSGQPVGLWAGARDINNSGKVVGWSNCDGATDYRNIRKNRYHAAVWTKSGSSWTGQNLGTLWTGGGGRYYVEIPSQAYRMNNSGLAAGWSQDGSSNGNFGCVWDTGVAWTIHKLGRITAATLANAYAYGINDDGDVVGPSDTISNSAPRACIWIRSGTANAWAAPVNLGTVSGGGDSVDRAINNDDVVVGAAYKNSNNTELRAVRWVKDGANWTITDLNSQIDPNSGWVLQEAWDINSAGEIVGCGIKDGQTRAFLLQPADTSPPSTPIGVQASALTLAAIRITWNASTGNVGVVGYRVFRNGIEVATTATTAYNDSGLEQAATYSYAVSAYDAAGNISAQSSPPASATTLVAVSVAAARSTPDGSRVGFSSMSVTAVFGGCFYVEDADRASGIKMVPTEMPEGLTVGRLVDVGGTLGTSPEGERYVGDASVVVR